jgi:hypothetical protein
MEMTKGSPYQRVNQFVERYSPLLANLTSYSLWRGTDAKKHGLYSTHILYILLEDFPSSAKSPRICIKHTALIKVESMRQHLQETFHTSQKDAPILSGMSDNFYFCACALMDFKFPNTVKGPVLSTLLPFTISDFGKDLKNVIGVDAKIGKLLTH